MGKATLSFDQVVIGNKRSDTQHNDNDWMTIVWFVQDQPVRTDTFPLSKADGDTSLDTGAVIAPFSSAVDCGDNDLVTATFVVVNLGSTDGAGQRAQAENIAKVVAKGVADAYVQAVEFVVREGLPLGKVFADGIEKVRGAIVDSVGAAFDDIIAHGIEDVLGLLGIGPPNCNGEVLHDIAVFEPAAVYPITTIHPSYTAESPGSCGENSHTSLVVTLQRDFSAMQFPNTPPPTVELVPVHGQSEDLWLATWADTSSAPIISVTVSRSLRASGLYSVEIRERVDPIHDVVYETGADPVSVIAQKVVAFGVDIYGALRPWVAHPVVPTGMSVVHRIVAKPHVKSLPAGAPKSRSAAPVSAEAPAYTTAFTRSWSRPVIGTLIGSGGSSPVTADALPGIASDVTDAIHLPSQGILLCLYEIRQSGNPIGNAVRYLRTENSSYTHADVMLYHWNSA